MTAEQASSLLRAIAAELPRLAAVSRKVMVGTRDLNGPSCVWSPEPGKKHDRPKNHVMDAAGGPAGRLVALVTPMKFDSAEAQFHWFQTRLREALAAQSAENAAVAAQLLPLSAKTVDLARGIAAWQRWPDGIGPAEVAQPAHWPGYCLQSLNLAVAAGDLNAARRWARELASAMFALTDLHRWLDLLVANLSFSLHFQAKCEHMFGAVDASCRAHGLKYLADRAASGFPGFTTQAPVVDNLEEVERQAERLFATPGRSPEGVSTDISTVPAAVWMPPDLRRDFIYLRSHLSPPNQSAWDQAAAAPFHRSYLANILFRMSKAGAIELLAVVLRRFDDRHPRAHLSELMDVMFYRGEVCGGLLWADRFDSRLMQAAGRMSGNDEQILYRAHGLTNSLFGGWENYKGSVWTLREALDLRKFDCVRGTDMIGALFRNAGHSGYYCLRLCAGVAGHSLSAVHTQTNGRQTITIVDPLVGPTVRQNWPEAFFGGYGWPRGYPDTRGPVCAVELNARGLDNYLLAEGYVVRGPNAGILMRAALPYLPGREKADTRKVYAGPYPPMPAPPRNVVQVKKRAGN